MRKAILVGVLAVLLLSGTAEAQDFIRYVPSSVPSSGGTLTGPLLVPDGSGAAPSVAASNNPDTGMNIDGTPADAIDFFVNGGSYKFSITASSLRTNAMIFPAVTDYYEFGMYNLFYQTGYFSRSIQGFSTLALADNTKTAFATVGLQSTQFSYMGGDVIWTLRCADATDQVVRSGRLPFAMQQVAADTETCVVGTTSSSGDIGTNSKVFTTVTFTCANGGTNKIQLEVQADCSIASPTAMSINYRLDLPTGANGYGVVTPGT